ncbi:sigma factor-like helix-turn-helix DNA-binding protein [Synechococcus sp. Cruz CV-v-12]|uniref:sigma factor-like helix-turn-helix DNA-binding protein n=1 Tax=Synechococcus sp. Cruz CV-v-12 TaxID=2823728 RepID=UPI0020CE9E94|nr:sigma factor-like helix-turn-helix DNA-binding protein [Synechococcus sp. Cruz CV-v-12]
MEALLDRLPAAQAAVIRLSLLEGQSLRQIGAKLGTSAMSAQRRRQAGLAHLGLAVGSRIIRLGKGCASCSCLASLAALGHHSVVPRFAVHGRVPVPFTQKL